jgi:hypothetical protein
MKPKRKGPIILIVVIVVLSGIFLGAYGYLWITLVQRVFHDDLDRFDYCW